MLARTERGHRERQKAATPATDAWGLGANQFGGHCGDDGLQPIGRFAVAGFAEQMVYGLADEGKDAP